MTSDFLMPNRWAPRVYQHSFWKYMSKGGRRAIKVWPRRHGKDDTDMHWMAYAAIQRTATYWYMLPEAAQARKAIWTAINPHTGQKRIHEAFPLEIIKRKSDQEMFLELVNGSTVQIVGSDNYNSLVGSPPYGVVFSEWALANPEAWAYLRPILRENGGWAIFNGTPRGRNHLSTMYDHAMQDEDWFAEKLTWEDANVFSKGDMDIELREYINDYGKDQGTAMFDQEYNCSFDAAVLGAYYSGEMASALSDGRITKVPYQTGKPVHTMWDLGKTDRTVAWMFQEFGQAWHIIGCVANQGVDLDWFIKEFDKLDYVWGTDYVPHDAAHERIGMKESIDRQLRDYGRGKVVVVKSPPGSVQVGINAVRKLIGKCWFDEKACGQGLEAMRMYRKEWDDKKKMFRDRPRHDWCSDFADAFRTGAMGHVIKGKVQPLVYNNNGIV